MITTALLAVGLVPATQAAAAPAPVLSAEVSITDGTDVVTQVDASAMAYYYVNVAYGCSTAACANTTVTIDPTPLDPTYDQFRKESDIQFVPPDGYDASILSGNLADGYTVSLGDLAGGSGGSFTLKYRINSQPPGVVGGSFFPDGSPITPQVTITADGATPAEGSASATWVSQSPTPRQRLAASASAIRTDKHLTITAGGDTLCVHYNGASALVGSPWATCAKSYTSVVTLPADAEYVPDTGGDYDPATRTVTFHEDEVDAAGGPDFNVHSFEVTFPSSAFPATGDGCSADETFTSTLAATYIGDDTPRSADDASVTVTAQNCTPFGKGELNKWISDADAGTSSDPVLWIPLSADPSNVKKGSWRLEAYNEGNVTGVITITDDTVSQQDVLVTSVTASYGAPATIDYTLDDNTSGTVTLGSGEQWSAPDGLYIVKITATSSPLVGPNPSPDGTEGTLFRIYLNFTVPYGTSDGAQRTNTATASLTYPDYPNIGTIALGPAKRTVTLSIPHDTRISIASSQRPAASTEGGGVATVGSTVDWTMNASLLRVLDGQAYRPQYVFLAPQGWDIVGNSASITGLADATFDYRTVNYDGDSYDALVATWPADITATGDIDLPRLSVQTRPTAAAAAGESTARLFVANLADGRVDSYYLTEYTNTDDLAGDGDTDRIYAERSGTTTLAGTSAIGVTKAICRPDASAADGCDWISTAGATVDVPANATSIKYRVTLTNTGNTALNGVIGYDVLPYIGDTGTSDATATTPRGSTVQEKLAGVGDVSDGLSLAYSTSTNPSRPEVYTGSTDAADWDAPAAGASAIRATVAGSLVAHDSVSFTYTASLVGASADQTACNSVAVTAQGLTAIEPAPVCATTQAADLAVNTADRFPLQVGRDGIVPFTVVNHGGSNDAPASVTVTLAAGVTPVALDSIAGWDCAVSGVSELTCDPVDGDGNPRTLPIDDPQPLAIPLRPGADADTSVCVTADVQGTIYDPQLGNNSATSCSDVVPGDQLLTVTKSDGVDAVTVGSRTTYQITVANRLVAEALAGATLTDTLPAGETLVSASDGGSADGQTVTWDLATLRPAAAANADGTAGAPSADASITVTVTVLIADGARDSLTNSAAVSAPDPADATASLTDQAEDTDTVTNVFVDADPAITTPHDTRITTPLDDIVTTTGAPLDPGAVDTATGPDHGAISIDTGSGAVTYTPDAGYTGDDSYTVRVCDTSSPAQCHTSTVQVSVGANTVNASADYTGATPGEPVTTDVLGNDTTGSTLTPLDPASVTVTTDPQHGATTVNADGTITYTPDAAWSGVDTYTYRVCDASVPEAVCDSASVTISVPNLFVDGPAADGNTGVSTPQNAPITTPLAAIVTTTGAPVDPATMTTDSAPEHGTIAINPDGSVAYTPDAGYTGPDSYAVNLCDRSTPSPGCHTVTVAVTVLPNVVTVADQRARTQVDTATEPIDVLGGATSASGQPLGDPRVASDPQHGTAAVNGDGTITYTPADGYTGTDSFTVTVCDTGDPAQACDAATITVNVVAAPDPVTTTPPTTATTTPTTPASPAASNDPPSAAPTAAGAGGTSLADTGADAWGWARVGLLLLLAGAAVLMLTRRRHARH